MFFRKPSPAWDAVAYWALDLETSGLDAKRDAILSVGMVPVRSGAIRWGERFESFVRPDGAPLSEEGLRAHHILPGELAGAPALSAVLEAVDARLRDGALLVHFAPLDVAFLRTAYAASGRAWPAPRVVDTVRLLEKLHHRQHHLVPHPVPLRTALPEAREDLGLPPHEGHDALSDALATAELFLVLRARLGARSLRELS